MLIFTHLKDAWIYVTSQVKQDDEFKLSGEQFLKNIHLTSEEFAFKTLKNKCAVCFFFLPEGRICGEGANSSERPLQPASAALSKLCRETALHPEKAKQCKSRHRSLVSISTETKRFIIRKAKSGANFRFLLK